MRGETSRRAPVENNAPVETKVSAVRTGPRASGRRRSARINLAEADQCPDVGEHHGCRDQCGDGAACPGGTHAPDARNHVEGVTQEAGAEPTYRRNAAGVPPSDSPAPTLTKAMVKAVARICGSFTTSERKRAGRRPSWKCSTLGFHRELDRWLRPTSTERCLTVEPEELQCPTLPT